MSAHENESLKDRAFRFALTIGCLLLPMFAGAVVADTNETQLNPYGYIRLDIARDSAVSSNGNYVLFVKPHAQGKAVSTTSITARQSRLGLRVQRGEMRGRLEIDFYGSSPENKSTIMLRYAYVTLPLGGLSLEAGQTSDMFSPLVPLTVNYSVVWGAGNVGYRRPQVKLYRQTDASYLGLSVARNMSGDLDGDAIADGEASGLPAVQARCAVSRELGGRRATLGISGHYGKCRCVGAADYDSWSVDADVRIALSPHLDLVGEAYTGSNMRVYAGGIYNGESADGIRSTGGWGNLQLRATDAVTFSIGASVDDLRDVDAARIGLERSDVRVRNNVLFAGGFYKLSPEVVLGMELSRWGTSYGNPTAGMESEPTSLRLQWSVQGDF